MRTPSGHKVYAIAAEYSSAEELYEAAKRVRDAGFKLMWVEDPILRNDFDGLRLLRQGVPWTLINSGEYLGAAGKRQLWLRPLDSFAAQPLTGTEGAAYSFWSPDGRYIAFFADNKLKKLDIGSGVIETICQTGRGAGRGGDWNRQGDFQPRSIAR